MVCWQVRCMDSLEDHTILWQLSP